MIQALGIVLTTAALVGSLQLVRWYRLFDGACREVEAEMQGQRDADRAMTAEDRAALDEWNAQQWMGGER